MVSAPVLAASSHHEREVVTCHSDELLALTLTVPQQWAESIAATADTLVEEFPALPRMQFAPHISLCQRFRPALFASSQTGGTGDADLSLAAITGVIGRVLDGRPVPFIRAGEVRCFTGASGGSEVVYLAVEAEWLRQINHLLVLKTAPFRAACGHSPGKIDFDLSGFTPHITLLLTRDLPVNPPLHAAIAARAASLWSMVKPHGDGFRATEVVLSATKQDSGSRSDPLRSRPIGTWSLPLDASQPDRP